MYSNYNRMADLFTSTMLKFPQYSVSFEDPLAFTTTISFVSCSICFNISQWYQLKCIQLTVVYVCNNVCAQYNATYVIHDLGGDAKSDIVLTFQYFLKLSYSTIKYDVVTFGMSCILILVDIFSPQRMVCL